MNSELTCLPQGLLLTVITLNITNCPQRILLELHKVLDSDAQAQDNTRTKFQS
jgi:hypothetical protein